MKRWLHEVEIIVDRIIPYLVVLIILIVIADIFFTNYVEPYHLLIESIDYFIISVFVIDLIFKFNRVRKFKIFLRKYWLDILAVFPFFLLFRAIEEIALILRLEKEVSQGQQIIHSGVEVQRIVKEEVILKELRSLDQGGRIVSELEKGASFTRTRFITRFLKPFQRIPRLFKIYPVYEKPIRKDIKKVEKEIGEVGMELGLKKRR
jgi:hypothetical protein